jgi:hypothetical protein
MMAVEPYQQRVIDEKKELDEKRENLELFFVTSKFARLEQAEQDRLKIQSKIMEAYSDILQLRIVAFGL